MKKTKLFFIALSMTCFSHAFAQPCTQDFCDTQYSYCISQAVTQDDYNVCGNQWYYCKRSGCDPV
ncbi:hypothetical protein [Marinicella sp. W31]|uniref:hypothetical protein n=1 Tax=Marinicella sp. W31 TaxID=3023713 RepID=UPI003756A411